MTLATRALSFAVRAPYLALRELILRGHGLPVVQQTNGNVAQVDYDTWFDQKILRINGAAYWPMHRTSRCTGWRNVRLGVDTAPGYMHGGYIQAIGPVAIGSYTRIAANVGIISSNHNVYDGRIHEASSVIIGSYCWLGANCVVLPGVRLGNFTIVGAGAVVTKPFPEGYCVLVGNPARVVKRLDPSQCVYYEVEHKYHGYIPADEYVAFAEKNLNPLPDSLSTEIQAINAAR